MSQKEVNKNLPMIKYSYPIGSKFEFEVFRRSQTHEVKDVENFLNHVNQSDQLDIAHYLDRITQEPFFLVAATGLGKTVSVPIHIFLRQCELCFSTTPQGNTAKADTLPRVWVVEPTIPIAESQCEYMNQWYVKFLSSQKMKNARNMQLFGSISSKGTVNPDAPIMFVTTGIIALRAKNHDLREGFDRVIIDEAHTTIEKSPDVEIAIGICHSRNVVVDYMSATVDTTGLAETLRDPNIILANEQRYPIWMHNLEGKVEDCIEHLVEQTLVHGNTSSEYYPDGRYPDQRAVTAAVLEKNRSHGLLVVVDSFEGDSSDVNKIAKLIENAPFNQDGKIAVMRFASTINRDIHKKEQFERELEMVEERNQNYVIVSTSVVEMGITFPTLDYVVTMDSGFDNITVGDRMVPKSVPLGVNALKQRIGRVGRRRPGIGYIANEIGAHYTELNDKQLNTQLDYEQISFPLTTSPLTSLAYYIAKYFPHLPLETIPEYLHEQDLVFPSGVLDASKNHETSRLAEFYAEIDKLVELEVLTIEYSQVCDAHYLALTALGESCEKWVGMNDLFAAIQLQKMVITSSSNLDPADAKYIFWLVFTALAHIGLTDMQLNKADCTYEGNKKELNPLSEVDALTNWVVKIFVEFGSLVSPGLLQSEQEALFENFQSFCNASGFDARRCLAAMKTISSVFTEFCKINRDNQTLKTVFALNSRPDFAVIDWHELLNNASDQYALLLTDPNRSVVEISTTKSFGNPAFRWQEIDGEKRSGVVEQQHIAVELKRGSKYSVKILGQVDRQDTELIEWTPVHWLALK